MKRYIGLVLLFQAITLISSAQQIIHGRILDSGTRTVMAGVIIKAMGTDKKVVSDAAGRFQLDLRSRDQTLSFHYVGFKAKQMVIKAPQKGELLVLMEEEAKELDEVLIKTGYEEISKERITGSFVHLDQKLINRSVGPNVLHRLKDVVPGLIFTQAGNTNENAITIRGKSTLFSDAQPLIVLDNFPYNGDLSAINPDDIESITVLKDAAAASIWGARAGNGVIVLTTKKGKLNDKTHINFSQSTSIIEKPDLFYQPVLGSADFIEIEKMLFDKGFYRNQELALNKPALSPVVELLIAKRDGKMDKNQADAAIEQLKKYDFRKEYETHLSQNAINQQYALNISGGAAKHSFFILGGLDKNRAPDVGNGYKRYSLSFRNRQLFLHDKLIAELNLMYNKSVLEQKNGGIASINMSAVNPIYPYARLVDEEGRPAIVNHDYRPGFLQDAQAQGLLDWTYSPIKEMQSNHQLTGIANSNAQLSLKYLLNKDLNLNLLYQYALEQNKMEKLQDENSYYTRDQINRLSILNTDKSITRPIPLGGILDLRNQYSEMQNVRMQMNYAKSMGKDHSLTALAGVELSDRHSLGRSSRLYGYDAEHAISRPVDYVNGYTLYVHPSFVDNKIPFNESITDLSDRFFSYFMNAGYRFKGRYMLTGSARKDASNLFGVNVNQKGVPLWSAGLGWLLSEESFYKLKGMPFLKLRLSYGYSGNSNKEMSAYTTAGFSSNAPDTGLPYAKIVNPPNPELRWERIQTMNAGLDFKLKWGISGSIEYYHKRGLDLFGQTPFAPSSGIINFYGNVANTKTDGLDAQLSAGFNLGKLRWDAILQYSYVKDEVTGYKVNTTGASYVSSVGTPLEGKPLYSIYYYPWAGLDAQNGDPMGYLDGKLSKDWAKIMTATTKENISYAGSARPTSFGSLRNTFSYGNFSLSFNISYRFGYYFRKPSLSYGTILTGKGGHADYLNRWQKPGDELFTDVPSMPALDNASRDNFYRYSRVNILKGDHIRFQDLRLDYRGWKKRVNLFLYAQNLGILWRKNKDGIDPDYVNNQSLKSISAGVQIQL